MEQKESYVRITFAFIGLLIVLLTGIVVYNFWKTSKEDRLLKERKEKRIEHIYNDTWRTHQLFKNYAEQWNSRYAKLTLNHTRDTIVHPKYTVGEFGSKHDYIVAEIHNLKERLKITDPIPMEYVVKEFDLDYNARHLVNTYRLKDDFFDLSNQLEHAFSQIIHHKKPSDSVKTNVYEKEQSYTSYFKLLREMDRIYSDLLVFRYPKDLTYLTNTSEAFINLAKHSALGQHVNALENRHRMEKDEAEPQ